MKRICIITTITITKIAHHSLTTTNQPTNTFSNQPQSPLISPSTNPHIVRNPFHVFIHSCLLSECRYGVPVPPTPQRQRLWISRTLLVLAVPRDERHTAYPGVLRTHRKETPAIVIAWMLALHSQGVQ